MTKSTSWKSGDWWAICDQCGLKDYASKMTKRWDGRMVHKDPAKGCFETRHPQEFLRGRPDSGKVAWTRPDRDLNADGTPRLTQAPTFNCSGASLRMYHPLFSTDVEIGKGWIQSGPMIVEDGVTVTVKCELVVE